MKTPRQFLLQRHQAQESQLDALSQSVLATLAQTRESFTWREFFLSLRWHAVGLSAAWAVAAFFYCSGPANPTNSVLLTQSHPIKLDAVYLAALRQNQQELKALIEDTNTFELPPTLPPRRSDRSSSIATV